MRTLAIGGVVVNAALVLGSLWLLAVGAFMADVQMRSRFTQLDRAGVINEAALDQFHPSYGFKSGHVRNVVPRFIAGPVLEEAKRNASLLFLLASANLVLWVGALVAIRKKAIAAEPGPASRPT